MTFPFDAACEQKGNHAEGFFFFFLANYGITSIIDIYHFTSGGSCNGIYQKKNVRNMDKWFPFFAVTQQTESW